MMTEAELTVLRDKYVLYERASREGPMDMRDYNRRAAEAMKALLSEREEAANALGERDAARDTLALWMLNNSYATGHGDTIEDLIAG
jgi:hypothetical protein